MSHNRTEIFEGELKIKNKKLSDCVSFFCGLTESTYRHQANIDDEVVTMEILDTAGQVG